MLAIHPRTIETKFHGQSPVDWNEYTRIRNDPSGWYLHQYTLKHPKVTYPPDVAMEQIPES